MSNGEQKDFLDLVADAGKKKELAQEFVDLVNKEGATALGLCEFLHNNGYGGVSPKDCEKILALKASVGKIEVGDASVKY